MMKPGANLPAFAHRLWRSVVRVLISLLAFLLFVAIYLALSPNALEQVIMLFDPPGVVSIPAFGTRPAPPQIDAARGDPPAGPLALTGVYESGTFACGFLLQLEDGQRLGVSTAHAAPYLPARYDAAFFAPDGSLAARLTGQIARGTPFRQAQFSTDYALWRVGEIAAGVAFLKPDSRLVAQPGERFWLYDPFKSDQVGVVRHSGIVLQADSQAIWAQMDDSFEPSGFSGCPLVSEHTGRVIGMAVAGEDLQPVMIGANPIAAIIANAQLALNK